MSKLRYTYTVAHHTARRKEWMVATREKETNLAGAGEKHPDPK